MKKVANKTEQVKKQPAKAATKKVVAPPQTTNKATKQAKPATKAAIKKPALKQAKTEPEAEGKKDQLRTQLSKKKFLAALKQSLGIVSNACSASGVGRTIYYEWMKDDPEFKAEVEDIAEHVIDFAETSLMKQIKEQNTAATIFYLKTKAKKRGYIEANINYNANREIGKSLDDMSDEELDEIIKEDERRKKG